MIRTVTRGPAEGSDHLSGLSVQRMLLPSGWQGFVLSFNTEQIIVRPPLDIPGLDLEKDRGRASVAEALFTDIIGD